ncbi:hypothetical protein PHLCEN_2v9764 [Hermanssonia centrifuga]|uniref:AAA+ ATPase domain-containing protein n=1 Tax=Hermanssonia centrifuga TaxID=98765 RepID=A0A2R6NPZ1_9APHY|nr:hypothetical protein PHLCEN_2v9764 [Hermanssonia centrifuga]
MHSDMLPAANLVSNGISDHGRPRRDQPPVTGEASTMVQDVTPFGLKLDVKRILLVWSEKKKDYVTEMELEEEAKKRIDDSAQYAFTLVRPVKPSDYQGSCWVDIRIHVRSQYFVKAAKVVMKAQRNVAWEANPVKFQYHQLLAFLPEFKEYASSLAMDELEATTHLDFLIDFMELEYQDQLRELRNLREERRVSFPLLWGAFLPGTLLVTNCKVTGEPIAMRLVQLDAKEATLDKCARYTLLCEYVDFSEQVPAMAHVEREILEFTGDVLLSDMAIRPIYVEEQKDKLLETLAKRGQRYWELSKTWCHKRYSTIAWSHKDEPARWGTARPEEGVHRKTAVNSRIVIDRDMYDRYAEYSSPPIQQNTFAGQKLVKRFSPKDHPVDAKLPLEDLILIPAVLYGFSLGDRQWLEFNVNDVEDITWDPQSFNYLEIPDKTKNLVRALIESHVLRSAVFSDVVAGKGAGLILNFHGPPGVGKTLTAEVICEVVQRPLYMVGAGDLGTTANDLDIGLRGIFTLATAWKAVVLIDEADVFLEERSTDDLKRNAMVAVFLRQLEYFPGILILTTNRVGSFDNAIRSRIHVSLTFDDLTSRTRERLWRSFLRKAGLNDDQIDGMNIENLFSLPFNGREIKNIIQTASTYASHCGRKIDIEDVLLVTETNKEPFEKKGA